MDDLEEANRLLGKAYDALNPIQPWERPADRMKLAQKKITDALAKMENMEDKIKDVIADMDWRGLHNDVIILRRLKDIIPPRTSEEETERMKVRWPKKPLAEDPFECDVECSTQASGDDCYECQNPEEPEKEGEWLYVNPYLHIYKCSICSDTTYGKESAKCPSCGASMEVK